MGLHNYCYGKLFAKDFFNEHLFYVINAFFVRKYATRHVRLSFFEPLGHLLDGIDAEHDTHRCHDAYVG